MPKIGERKNGRALGRDPNISFIWTKCPDCSKERWVVYDDERKKKVPGICPKCYNRGVRNCNWKGGRYIDKRTGYVVLTIQPSDPFYSAIKKHHNGSCEIFEHRYVMAKKLGRLLETWEIVHHKGTKYLMDSPEDKQDNREENLELVTNSENHQIKNLNTRVIQLEAEVTLLRFQIGESSICKL
jgi:ribosomal protein S27E